jgi:NTE family protein
MAALPADVTVHVLPAGAAQGRGSDLSQLRYRDYSRVEEYIDRARTATTGYLASS